MTHIVPGILRAFDAEDVTKELWNSDLSFARDSVGQLAKYVPPTIALGRVYLATFSNAVAVYGLKEWATVVSISDRPVGLTPGATFTRTIIFQNTGDTIWDMTSFSVVPASATAWGVTSIALPRSTPVSGSR